MTETTTTDRQLPYGGTVNEMRQTIARHAQHGETGCRPLQDLDPEQVDTAFRAHHAALYGWSVVALLRWLGEKFGPDTAWRAAAIVQDLGENGGNSWVNDIPYLWAVHVQGPDDILAAGDRTDADRMASEINEVATQLANRPDASPNDPKILAVVVPWEGTAEHHAEALAEQQKEGGYVP